MSYGKLTKSICDNAGGFSFFSKSSSNAPKYIFYINGPCTVIPDSDIDEESIVSLFNNVYPDKTAITVLSDTIHELSIRILYGIDNTYLADISQNYQSVPLQYHITDIIRDIHNSRTDTIAVINNDSNGNIADIVVIKGGKLLSLNQISADKYELTYTIAKIWKEFGFKKIQDKIKLYRFKDGNSIKENLTQMTGENTVCVL